MHRVEFTIEPFVEGQPGPHVVAPVDALEAMGITVDVGPFGSSCLVAADAAEVVVAAIVGAAIANGATHVNVDVARQDTIDDTIDGTIKGGTA